MTIEEITTERDALAKLLGEFRDFVVANATMWKPGANHHNPIWARVADAINGEK